MSIAPATVSPVTTSAALTKAGVAMADGSVKTMSYSIDILLHRALASIAGDEIVE